MSESLFSFSSELLPQEETIAISKKKGRLSIGMPNETCMQEKRVALTPEGVYLLTSHGHEVTIETGVGEGARYTDKDYSEAGAKVVYSPKEAYESNIILKIEPPSEEEFQYMTSKQTLLSALQLKTRDKQFFDQLIKKKATAIAIEHIRDDMGNKKRLSQETIAQIITLKRAGHQAKEISAMTGVIKVKELLER